MAEGLHGAACFGNRHQDQASRITSLADGAIAMVMAPRVTLRVGIAQIAPVFAALGISVGNRNPHHLSLDVGKKDGLALCADCLSTAETKDRHDHGKSK
jgi:hypothetical protein